VQSDGITGSINVTFEYPPMACYLPTWQGTFGSLAMDADQTRLQFAFVGASSPIQHDLTRCE
jgi:hypothetical protein